LNDRGEDILTGTTFCGANPTHDRHEREKGMTETETVESTETETVETETAEPKKFGLNVADLAAHDQCIEELNKAAQLARVNINAPYDTARKALFALFPNNHSRATRVWGLVSELTDGDRYEQLETTAATFDRLINAAKQQRMETLSRDPFAKFVEEDIRPNHGASYAEILHRAMPLTFDGLQELAHQQGWCAEYEAVMARAVREGALPDDRVEVVRAIHWRDVPKEYAAKAGEEWRVVMQIPAYARSVDSNGTALSALALLDHARAEDTRYERVSPEPVPADDSSPEDIG
jgi:hypothetical protein